MADKTPSAGNGSAEATRDAAKDLERRLHRGQLPQMVDWFDPLVLGMVAVRTLISTTIGDYADQRPMQEIMDGDKDDDKVDKVDDEGKLLKRRHDGKLLTRRHDYSTLNLAGNAVYAPEADRTNARYDKELYEHPVEPPEPRQLELEGETKAMWVDFIADLGDGFEATYAMAYLLAKEKLQVSGETQPLSAGQILIFGGDLAYPNATLEEYRTRCVDPYEWAFTAGQAQPKRELFFVAGNHDWYDGLSAFTHQFCYETESVGGWRCTQRRSYFSIKLPYNWWIWGVDVALGDSIDMGQVEYFQAIAKGMERKDNPKVVIILHAPDWTKPPYKALARICELARWKGEICAILAGDLHHYSRYRSVGAEEPKKTAPRRDPPLDLIVSGGGGAFAHPTYDLKRRLKVDAAVAGRTLLPGRDFRSFVFAADKEPEYDFKAETFYPSRRDSRLLALKNLWLPFHNRRFALLIGFIYFLYAWVFSTSVGLTAFAPRPSESIFDLDVASAAAVAATARANPTFFFMLLGLWVGLVFYVDAKLEHRLWRWLNGPIKVVFGTLHFLAHLWALLLVSALTEFLRIKLLDPAIGAAFLNAKIFIAEFWQDGFFFSGTTDAALKSMQDCADKFDWSESAWNCVQTYVGGDAFYIGATALAYAATSIVVGGVIGAFIFGCYWVITSTLFGMHQDAFSALAIKDYKNFLRMKFEKDQLTIYPIAIDRIPRAREWRAWNRKDEKDPDKQHKPLLVPRSNMNPRLIEDKIEIKKGAPPAPAQGKQKGT